jgi:hypothetical protein
MKHPTPALEAYIAAALYPSQDSVRNAFQMMSGVDEKIPSHIIDDFIERMLLSNAKAAFISTLLGLKNSSTINHRLVDISVPALVIWGKTILLFR